MLLGMNKDVVGTFEGHNPRILNWLYRCHRSPETGELFARVIDWELAFFLADADRYLSAMVVNFDQSGLVADRAEPLTRSALLAALIQANDLQRSGETLLTGLPWIILVELAQAAAKGGTLDATQLAAAARCSLNTVSSVLYALADRGVLSHRPDPSDKRKRQWLIADRGWAEVTDYCQKNGRLLALEVIGAIVCGRYHIGLHAP